MRNGSDSRAADALADRARKAQQHRLVHSAARASSFLGLVALAGTACVGALTILEGFWARGKLMATHVPQLGAPNGIFNARADEPDVAGEPRESAESAELVELALVGDSLAYGLGATRLEETIAVRLATGLSAASGHSVRLTNVAAIGAESKDLPSQLSELCKRDVNLEVVLIVIGANEVMRLHSIAASIGYLADAVRNLRALGASVVVATCPDLGAVAPFVPPLGFIARTLSRLLATAQTIVVLRSGGRTVSLGDTLGPLFRHDPAVMFAADLLHPSAEGYARAADVLLPSVCAAAGYRTGGDASVPHRVYRRGVRSPVLVWLAFRASHRAGVETSSGRQGNVRTIETRHRTMLRLHGRIQRLIRVPARDITGSPDQAAAR